jgi:peroxiredoxin
MLRRADDLASLAVLDEGGKSVELGGLWRDRTVVLLFTRHFGCIHCREHIVAVHGEIDRIHAKGAELVVIGNGAPNFIAGFRELTGYRGPLYTDPSLKVFEAAQLERGVGKTLDPRGWMVGLRAMAQGHRQGRTQGDQWQQGGVLVIAPGGTVKWQHVSKRAGDNATPAAIISAL